MKLSVAVVMLGLCREGRGSSIAVQVLGLVDGKFCHVRKGQFCFLIISEGRICSFKYQVFQVCFGLLLQNSREVKQLFGGSFVCTKVYGKFSPEEQFPRK